MKIEKFMMYMIVLIVTMIAVAKIGTLGLIIGGVGFLAVTFNGITYMFASSLLSPLVPRWIKLTYYMAVSRNRIKVRTNQQASLHLVVDSLGDEIRRYTKKADSQLSELKIRKDKSLGCEEEYSLYVDMKSHLKKIMIEKEKVEAKIESYAIDIKKINLTISKFKYMTITNNDSTDKIKSVDLKTEFDAILSGVEAKNKAADDYVSATETKESEINKDDYLKFMEKL